MQGFAKDRKFQVLQGTPAYKMRTIVNNPEFTHKLLLSQMNSCLLGMTFVHPPEEAHANRSTTYAPISSMHDVTAHSTHSESLLFTVPGLSNPIRAIMPVDTKLKSCQQCKQAFLPRDVCRKTYNHTSMPWSETHFCICIDDSCLHNGHLPRDKYYIAKPVPQEDEDDRYFYQHCRAFGAENAKRIVDIPGPCYTCSDRKYTTKYCRQNKAHAGIIHTSVCLKLFVATDEERCHMELEWSAAMTNMNVSFPGNDDKVLQIPSSTATSKKRPRLQQHRTISGGDCHSYDFFGTNQRTSSVFMAVLSSDAERISFEVSQDRCRLC